MYLWEIQDELLKLKKSGVLADTTKDAVDEAMGILFRVEEDKEFMEREGIKA